MKIIISLLFLLSFNCWSMDLSDFQTSLKDMVSRGLITKQEATKHLVEYQFQLENNQNTISKREPARNQRKNIKEF